MLFSKQEMFTLNETMTLKCQFHENNFILKNLKMESKWILSVEELEANLIIDKQSIGTFIGISDRTNNCWKLAIYLG